MTPSTIYAAAAVVALAVAAAVADEDARQVLAEAAWDAADEGTAYLPSPQPAGGEPGATA